jgi:hypothetical protein
MSEELLLSQSSRQPDPEPPDAVPAPTPSLWLYLGLLALAVVMVITIFLLHQPEWPGLLLNLATEIAGAVIILILVDRRIRSSEVSRIRDYATASSVRFASFFSRSLATAASYAQVFGQQLDAIRPEPYLDRPELEALLGRHPGGFVLCGPSGTGKSTLVQGMAARQAAKVARRPRVSRIPVLLPAAQWREADLVEAIYEEMCDYWPIKRDLFDRWLAAGRLLLIVDALEEHPQPKLAFQQIEELRARHPSLAVIVTSRSLWAESSQVQDSSLPKVEIRLSEAEVRELQTVILKRVQEAWPQLVQLYEDLRGRGGDTP